MGGVERVKAHISGDTTSAADTRNDSNLIEIPLFVFLEPLQSSDECCQRCA